MQINYGATGASTAVDALGMRDMQARAYAKRRERYLLLKAPPASGKSRALMYLALDKLERQGAAQGDCGCAGTDDWRFFRARTADGKRIFRGLDAGLALQPVHARSGCRQGGPFCGVYGERGPHPDLHACHATLRV